MILKDTRGDLSNEFKALNLGINPWGFSRYFVDENGRRGV